MGTAVPAPVTRAMYARASMYGWWVALRSTLPDTVAAAASLLTGAGPVSTITATILVKLIRYQNLETYPRHSPARQLAPHAI
jgi:hypothetical protein